jgi:hypothetical protein
VPMQVSRRPVEPSDAAVRQFYERLLAALKRSDLRDGGWSLQDCRPAWDGSVTWRNFIVFAWQDESRRLLACVNYGPMQGQCYVTLALPELRGHTYRLTDLLGDAVYDREGDGLAGNGLYLDLPAWGCHLFDMTSV